MNILYINSGYPTPEVGGVERVTYDLGQWFVSHGHRVWCLVLCGDIPEKNSVSFPCLKLPEKDGWGTEENLQAFREIQRIHKIDVIIVQSERIQAVELCSKGVIPGVKLVTVLHTSPVTQRGHFWDDCIVPRSMQEGWWQTFLYFPRLCVGYYVNRRGTIQWEKHKFQTMYALSDRYVTLSKSFHRELCRLGELQDGGHKLLAIPNPLSMFPVKYESEKKEKSLLWVGRMVFSSKKPDRIIRIWEKIAAKYPQWKLCLVGDGEDRSVLEAYCKRRHIQNVVFAGRQKSEPWYRKASILCVTSSFEGWGLVLTEAMNFGCVPIAYESYSSLRDIIADGEDGFCIPAFDEEKYIQKLSLLMENVDIRENMGRKCLKAVNRFRVDVVGQQWEKLLQEIVG